MVFAYQSWGWPTAACRSFGGQEHRLCALVLASGHVGGPPPARSDGDASDVVAPAVPFIQIDHLTKTFHSVTALSDLSLEVSRGELLCIMGANGAGKTTLLKIVAGVVLPTSGTVRIDGQDVTRGGPQLCSMIGFAAGERPGFYDRLTGRQNLEFFAALHGLHGAAGRQRIDEVLCLFEMAAPERPYQELSTGMKQRLLLARTLLHDPPILLLDEPTKSLDAAHAQRLLSLLKERCGRDEGKTIVMVTHQLPESRGFADRVVALRDGRLQTAS